MATSGSVPWRCPTDLQIDACFRPPPKVYQSAKRGNYVRIILQNAIVVLPVRTGCCFEPDLVRVPWCKLGSDEEVVPVRGYSSESDICSNKVKTLVYYKHVPNDEIVAEGVVERSLARNRIYMVFCKFQTIFTTLRGRGAGVALRYRVGYKNLQVVEITGIAGQSW